MRKFFTALVVIPLGLIAIIFAVANHHWVTVSFDPFNSTSPAIAVTLPLFVANGVTGVRDMGSDLNVIKKWRAEIEAGRLLGPRIILAGPMLDGPAPAFPASAK